MFTRGIHRILSLATLGTILAAAPAVGQMDWKRQATTKLPPYRSSHAMAYDAARDRIVVFGGLDGSQQDLNDTWTWDGVQWMQQNPGNSPPARSYHAMVYDAARKQVVLFGGSSGTNPGGFADTWTWDGIRWTRHQPPTNPPSGMHVMAYDSARQRVVLFGAGTYGNHTWEWDGQTWKQCPPPYQRFSFPPAMAYDAARRRTVLYLGGTNNDTWEWDGQVWIACAPATNPKYFAPAMAYDAARQRVLLFGGYVWNASYSNDTWEWDGKNWKQCTPTTSPPGRAFTAMAYDAARGAVVLFGGWNSYNGLPFTWAYAPTDLTASNHFVSVATGGNVSLWLSAGAKLAGRAYQVSGCMDTGVQRGFPLGHTLLLLTPDSYFWFNMLYPNSLIRQSLGNLDASGRAVATVRVPKLPSVLVGSRFYHAYVVFGTAIDYASTPVPLTMTQ